MNDHNNHNDHNLSDSQAEPLRLLLLSDTHGQVGVINDLARKTGADAVLHAGDFGFYDEGSYDRLSDRELRLQVMHSDLPKEENDRLLALPADARPSALKAALPLSEFPDYLAGRKRFDVPVYAVWGNHEDLDVVDRLFRGELQVENLHLLHHRQAFRIGPALVYGLGGNLLVGAKLLQRPLAGGSGRIWSTLSQYADLVETVERKSEHPGPRILVSHVSPGKEPFIEYLAARTRSDWTISGHMGAPAAMIWNPFAIREVDEAETHLQNGIDAVRRACMEAAGADSAAVVSLLDRFGPLPGERIYMGRRTHAPRWYRDMTHINLPDAHVGYAVLTIRGKRVRIETFVQ